MLFVFFKQFVTEGYTVLALLQCCGASSIQDVGANVPLSPKAKLAWLKRMSLSIVDMVP